MNNILGYYLTRSKNKSKANLAATNDCPSLTDLLRKRHHGKGCCETTFKLHIHNLHMKGTRVKVKGRGLTLSPNTPQQSQISPHSWLVYISFFLKMKIWFRQP